MHTVVQLKEVEQHACKNVFVIIAEERVFSLV